MSKSSPRVRYAEVDRETKETKVEVVVDLDGGQGRAVHTGLGFFDHMLHQLAFHGQLDLGLKATGDLHIDDHHLVEDVGIVLGEAFRQAISGSSPYVRYADTHSPMDDALILVAVDLSGRAHLGWDVPFTRDKVGELSTECVREFFQAFVNNAQVTLHVRKIAGYNDHHVIEAIFKGVGRVLHQATRFSDRKDVPSTKGSLGS